MYQIWHTITVMSKYNYVVDTDSYTQYYNCKGFLTCSIILNRSNIVCLYLSRIEDSIYLEQMHKMPVISITIGTECTSLSSFCSEVRWSVNKIKLNELYTSELMSLSLSFQRLFLIECVCLCVCLSMCDVYLCQMNVLLSCSSFGPRDRAVQIVPDLWGQRNSRTQKPNQ